MQLRALHPAEPPASLIKSPEPPSSEQHHSLSSPQPPSPLVISPYLHILLKIKILLHFSQGSGGKDLFSQPYLTPISWDNKAAAVGGLLTNARGGKKKGQENGLLK